MFFAKKYTPANLNDYHFLSQDHEEAIGVYLDGRSTTPLMFHGPPGTGKTLIARLLPKAICDNVDEATDVMFINGSSDTSISVIRDKVEPFSATIKFNKFDRPFVIFDECDGLSPSSQDALKGLMDKTQGRTQFIFTTNHLHRMKAPLIDRCTTLEFTRPTSSDLVAIAIKILQAEGVYPDPDTLLDVFADGCSFREMYRRIERMMYLIVQDKSKQAIEGRAI